MDFRSHKSELEELQQKDPEFFKYLQQNDRNLLDFESEDDVESSDEIQDNASVSLEEEVDNVPPASKELTKELFEKIIKKSEKGSLVDLRRLIVIFRSVSTSTSDDNEDNDSGDDQSREDAVIDNISQSPKYRISSASFYEEILGRCIDVIHRCLAYHLHNENKPLSMEELVKHRHWQKVKPLIILFIKSYIETLSSLIPMASKHQEVVIFYISQIELYLPFLTPLEQMLKKVSNILLKFWAIDGQSELECAAYPSIRENAFLRIRQLVQLMKNSKTDISESIFRSMYLTYVRNCKVYNQNSLVLIAFLTNSLIEIYKLDISLAYQQAFVYIRQLALHLRLAYIKKGESSTKVVRSWQYILSLKLWIKIVSVLSADNSGLVLLAYPIIQISYGLLNLFTSVYYLPLKFFLFPGLQELAARCKVFIPLNHFLCELVEEIQNQFGEKSVHDSEEQLTLGQLKFMLSFPSNTIHQKPVRDFILQEVLGCIRTEIELYRYSPSFPEYFCLLLKKLKVLSKCVKTQYYRDLLRTTSNSIQSASTVVIQNRARSIDSRRENLDPLAPQSEKNLLARFGSTMKSRDSVNIQNETTKITNNGSVAVNEKSQKENKQKAKRKYEAEEDLHNARNVVSRQSVALQSPDEISLIPLV